MDPIQVLSRAHTHLNEGVESVLFQSHVKVKLSEWRPKWSLMRYSNLCLHWGVSVTLSYDSASPNMVPTQHAFRCNDFSFHPLKK